ncbi:MAG: ATP-binding protein [Thermanaerothrix sp.]|nr:ATP-binding protein [Thermanaerothrix sp.]
MKELALHLLDIAENSLAAGARHITIKVIEDTLNDRLIMEVCHDGRRMDADMVARVVDPFVTTRTTRKVGLGIPLLKAAAEACNGNLTIESEVGKGTCVRVVFQRSHIDRMPLGDLAGTFLTLLVGNSHVNWTFIYQVDERVYTFESAPVLEVLQGVPLTEPAVLNYIRNELEEGIRQVQKPVTLEKASEGV